MKITISDEQKQELKKKHCETRDGRVRDYIKAVIHASNGWEVEEISDAIFIHRSIVQQYIKHYLHSNNINPATVSSQNNPPTHKTQDKYLNSNINHNYDGTEFDISNANHWIYSFDDDELKYIANIFIETVYNDIEDLNFALKTQSFEIIFSISHRLKGSMGFLGCTDLYNKCSELEVKSKNKCKDSLLLTKEIILDFLKEISIVKKRLCSLKE